MAQEDVPEIRLAALRVYLCVSAYEDDGGTCDRHEIR